MDKLNDLVRIVLNDIIKDAKIENIHIHSEFLNQENKKALEIKFSNSLDKEANLEMNLNLDNYESIISSLEKYAYNLLTFKTTWSEIGKNNWNSLNMNEPMNFDEFKDLNFIYNYIYDNFVFLLMNATKDDFLNPVPFIDRYSDFISNYGIEDNLVNETFYLSSLDCNLNFSIKEQPYGQETPNAMVCNLVGGKVKNGVLPLIRFGIAKENDEDVMYLYAIQNTSKTKFNFRNIYDLNSNVPEEYKTKHPSFVLAMGIVAGIMKQKNIRKLYMPHNLPLKVDLKYAHAISDEDLIKFTPREIMSLGITTKSHVDKIKYELDENFVNLGKRLVFHGSHITFSNVNDSLALLDFDHDKNYFNNPILEDTYNTLAQTKEYKNL